MEFADRLALLSPGGNEELRRALTEAGFEVLSVSEEKDVPPGIVVLDLTSPDMARKYLFGKQGDLQRLRADGYTVLASVSPETLKDDRAALAIGGAHAFLLQGERAASTRATVLAAIHRRVLDDRLRKSERMYRLLAENIGDVIWTWNLGTHRYDYVSPSVTRMRGYTVEEALALTVEESLTPESAVRARTRIGEALRTLGEGKGPAPHTDYYDQPCKDGSVKTIETTVTFILDGDGKPTHVLGVSRDATERMRDKADLEASLRQREVLLKELEHRVKNTLAMIAGLLSLASDQVKDPEDARLFEESQARVSALTLVYQKLLQSTDAERIDLGAYLEDLCRSVTSSFSYGASGVRLDAELDRFTVDSKRAALIGLAVNELVTNSMKYAVRPDSPLELRLEVRLLEGNQTQVLFRDNGPGLPEGFDPYSSGGLGFLLIRSLVSQLRGEFLVEPPGEGAGYRIVLPEAPRDGGPT